MDLNLSFRVREEAARAEVAVVPNRWVSSVAARAGDNALSLLSGLGGERQKLPGCTQERETSAAIFVCFDDDTQSSRQLPNDDLK